MKPIKLNNTVNLDLPKLISGKLLLQAASGGGKSFAIRRILEQSFSSIPQIILDTEGEFSSLREKYDYILIGKGLDINADPKTAALLATRLWSERVSAIIDLYELSPWDRQLFVKNFVDAMINAPKNLWKPVLLVIDEAHEYAPESDKSDSGRALHLLASKGRKRQIGALFATQRISSLSKNIVASCKNKLIGYASEINDIKRASFELGFTPAEGLRLRDLDPGEFYAFGPALTKEVAKIKIGPVTTTHEQIHGGGFSTVLPASAKVKKALAKLADLPQEAAAELRTVSELKTEIARLKRELSVKPIEFKVRETFVSDPKAIEKAVMEAVRKAGIEWEKVVGDWDKYADRLLKLIQTASYGIDELKIPAKVPLYWLTPSNLEKATLTLKQQKPQSGERLTFKPHIEISGVDAEQNLSKGARAILTYLQSVAPNGKTKSQLWIATGYAPNGGFNNYIYELTGIGRIHKDGNLYSSPVTNTHVEFDASLDKWEAKLSLGARKILNLLLENPNQAYTKLELAEITQYSMNGGFNNYVYELTGKELIHKRGNTYQINPEVFDL